MYTFNREAPNLLGIDTSGPVASCAVLSGGAVRSLIVINQGLTHSETVMPAVERALGAAGLSCGDIDCFVAVAGPGSFTGVRIGVCAVKGLAHASGRPCARVQSLEALAMNLWGAQGLCCPILDARRSQVYCAAYRTSGGLPREVVPPEARSLEAFLSGLPGDEPLIFTGDGVAVYRERIAAALGERARFAPPHLRELRADAACVLAAARPETWTGAAALEPVYLRVPQAERERRAGRDHTRSLRRQREEEGLK